MLFLLLLSCACFSCSHDVKLSGSLSLLHSSESSSYQSFAPTVVMLPTHHLAARSYALRDASGQRKRSGMTVTLSSSGSSYLRHACHPALKDCRVGLHGVLVVLPDERNASWQNYLELRVFRVHEDKSWATEAFDDDSDDVSIKKLARATRTMSLKETRRTRSSCVRVYTRLGCLSSDAVQKHEGNQSNQVERPERSFSECWKTATQ